MWALHMLKPFWSRYGGLASGAKPLTFYCISLILRVNSAPEMYCFIAFSGKRKKCSYVKNHLGRFEEAILAYQLRPCYTSLWKYHGASLIDSTVPVSMDISIIRQR